MRPTIFLTFCSMFFSINLFSQIINTIAGDGTLASGGDGGPAVSAQLYRPWPIAVDSTGKVYTVESGRLRMVNTSGIITTIAGTGVPGYSGTVGPATTVNIGNAFGMAYDKAGNLFLGQSSRVRKINAAGIISTVAGTGTNGYSGDGGMATAAQINLIHGVAIDDSGNLFIADRSNHRIRKVNTAGVITTVAGTGTAASSGDGGAATLADINSPYGVATDYYGNIYFTDGSNKVRKIDVVTGIINSIAGSGMTGYSGDGGMAGLATFRNLSGIAIDDLGNIFLGDAGNNVIRKVSTTGIITTVVGTGAGAGMGAGPVLFSGDGGPATAADLHQPFAVAVDDTGNIYVADQINNRLRKVTSGNHLPAFTGGTSQSFVMCADSIHDISTLLTVADANMGQPLTWVLMNGPTHGVASVTYSSVSTGGIVVPIGLTYTPAPGYSGNDTMRIRIDDDISAYYTTIYVTVNPQAEAGTITGKDTVCAGAAILLSNTVLGGVWSSSATSTASVSSAGTVTGVAPGVVVISYTVINGCGTDVAMRSITVLSPEDCPLAVSRLIESYESLNIWPNPNNTNTISLKLSSLSDDNQIVAITNMIGQKLLEIHIKTNEPIVIPVTMTEGIYSVSATLHGRLFHRKLVITK